MSKIGGWACSGLLRRDSSNRQPTPGSWWRALEGAGAQAADVVKLTTYVVGYKPELRPLLGEARSTVFGPGALPASTLVGVQALAEPGYLIEVEAFAVTDQA